MLLSSLLTNTILALFTMASAAEAAPGPGPISETTIPITHRTILSQRSFADTKAAFEAAIPPLNNTFRDLLLAGNAAGALAALQALPPLNSFVVPPRDFGALVRVQGVEGAKAVQYEIGNPLTASEVARFDLGVSVSVLSPICHSYGFLTVRTHNSCMHPSGYRCCRTRPARSNLFTIRLLVRLGSLPRGRTLRRSKRWRRR